MPKAFCVTQIQFSGNFSNGSKRMTPSRGTARRKRLADDRNNDFADDASGAFGPLVHPFFDRANGAEREPKQPDDPAGVENRGEQADVEKASRSANDAGRDRHQRERAAAHPKKKREWFA